MTEKQLNIDQNHEKLMHTRFHVYQHIANCAPNNAYGWYEHCICCLQVISPLYGFKLAQNRNSHLAVKNSRFFWCTDLWLNWSETKCHLTDFDKNFVEGLYDMEVHCDQFCRRSNDYLLIFWVLQVNVAAKYTFLAKNHRICISTCLMCVQPVYNSICSCTWRIWSILCKRTANWVSNTQYSYFWLDTLL